jgi:glycosyltransferase involved in cell wall biosynthesis
MTDRQRLDVVVPAFNEAAGLPVFHQRLTAVLDRIELAGRIIYVDDGSRDETWSVLTALAAADPRVATLRLSRNFGKELALTAGLDYADADAVVVIDADLQDPPELIPEFIARWRDGFDVVYGTRGERLGETWSKRASAALFYRLIGRISATPIPADTGDFRLLGRRAHQALKGLRERQRFMKGLFAWVGFRQCAVVYQRDPRHAGSSAFNFRKLWTFALDGITSFSVAPLKLATWIGMLTAVAAFGFGTWVIVKALLFGDPVAGYPSLMAVLLFLGGVQLLALGIIGEYLGRLYMESKQRPLYLLDAVEPAGNDPGAHPGP